MQSDRQTSVRFVDRWCGALGNKQMRPTTFFLLILIAPNAFGLTCGSQHQDLKVAVEMAYENYSAIFIATSTSVRKIVVKENGSAESIEALRSIDEDYLSLLGNYESLDIEETVLTIQKKWKGEIGSELVVRRLLLCCVDGYAFEKDVTYLVFVHEKYNGQLEVSDCSLTKPIGESAELIKLLDKIID